MYYLEVSSACVENPSGIYRYIRQLSRGMIQEAGIHAFGYAVRRQKLAHRNQLPYWMRPGLKAYEGLFFPQKGAQLLHGMDMKLPLAPKVASVVTAMDLAPFRLIDQQVSSQRFLKKKRKDYQKAFSRADLILSISQQTAADVCDLFGVDPGKIQVTHLGVQPEFSPSPSSSVLGRYGLSGKQGKYFFYVGSLSVRKNLIRLLQAYHRCSASKEIDLVLSGEISYGGKAILEEVNRLGLAKKVHLIGYAKGEDLPALYSQSAGFLFPTLYEGFGLPILEAMACGVPVLTGNQGASPEVAGGHALLTNPFEIEEMAAQIDRLPEVSMAQKTAAQTYAQGFTWEKTAQQTLAGYQEAIRRRG